MGREKEECENKVNTMKLPLYKPIRPPNTREVSPILYYIRNWLLGHTEGDLTTHRYEGSAAARTQPNPNLPKGVSHKASGNYYFTRDGRRDLIPMEAVFEASKPLSLQSGEENQAPKKPFTPGNVYLPH